MVAGTCAIQMGDASIAIVPCLTFLFAFLSAFGVVQPFMKIIAFMLQDTFGEQTGQELIDYIQQFSSNAMSLGVVGLVSFIITGILLVDKIYIAINNIFHTRPSSGTMRRFTFQQKARAVSLENMGT